MTSTEDKAMKLNIPSFPVEVVVTLVRKPPASRWKLSVRGLLIIIVVAALSTWGGLGVFDHYVCTPITKVYYVGDLLHPDAAQEAADLPKLAELLKSEAPRDMWSSRNRSVTPFFLSASLIVRDSNSGHQRVADWLRKHRSIELNCHRALQNQPLMGASKPAMTLGGFSSTV
jgi:hypothetical protein